MKQINFFLIFICIIVILSSGCTSTSNNVPTVTPVVPATTIMPMPTITPVVPATTIMPVTTAPNVTSTTQAAAVVTTPVPAVNASFGVNTTDPILHRWIREYGSTTSSDSTGYEFKFYPEGTVDYLSGDTRMVSGNIFIDLTQPYVEYSGTWTNIGNATYLVKLLPDGLSGVTILREYTLVPAHVDPDYPGITIPAQIQSSYEMAFIGAGGSREDPHEDIMYYPEQALIDNV